MSAHSSWARLRVLPCVRVPECACVLVAVFFVCSCSCCATLCSCCAVAGDGQVHSPAEFRWPASVDVFIAVGTRPGAQRVIIPHVLWLFCCEQGCGGLVGIPSGSHQGRPCEPGVPHYARYVLALLGPCCVPAACCRPSWWRPCVARPHKRLRCATAPSFAATLRFRPRRVRAWVRACV